METQHRPYYSTFLQAELEKRCSKNSSYSLRSFAQNLGMNAGTLSSILNLKRPLSFKTADKIIKKLKLTRSERNRVLSSVVHFQSGRDLKRRDPSIQNFPVPHFKNPRSLDVDLFKIISDWYHAAIMELTYQPDFKNDFHWMAKELGISFAEAKAAVGRLLEFGLIEEKNGTLIKVNDHLEIKDSDLTSSARRKKQKQVREKAIASIENDPVETRYMTTITMSIDPDLLPEARIKIDEFNDSLCAFLEQGKRKQVYTMEVGLFSLQRRKK